MKRKLCKSLCSMLLALAMVVGLMPGMGMTAYAAGGGTEVTQANVICQQYSYMDAGMYSSGGMYDTPPADITNIELADAQAFGAAVNCPTTYWVVVYAKDGDTLKWTSNGKTGEQTSTPYRTFSAWCELYNNDVFYIGGNCDPNQQVTFYFSKGLATVGVTGVSLNKETTTLTVGGTETLTATVRPDDATDKSVTWLSDNTNVATVDTNGLVTAVGVGTANITVTSNSDSTKNASCSVTVNPATYNVLLTGGSNATISGGSTSQSELSGAMETVTYTANSGYHFADFTDITQNGITVTKTSDSVVTVSGIPTADVNIVVPDAIAKTQISYTVTFNVENGSWDEGGSDAQTVTLTGYEGDTLNLAASQIPAVGSNPDATYKAGSWDTIPTAGMAITADTTFTYTYAAKTPISYTVTFNLANGSWNEGGSDAQTVTLTGYEGDTLTLSASQIPAVGSNPDATYKAGSWDTIPTAGMEITADTTFTYSYVKENTAPITYTNTEGEGSNYTLGTNGTLTFRFSRSENDAETINHFTGIKVDNVEVSSNNYTYSAGSVIINLKPEYLQTLSVGQHTLTAMFDDGGDVTVNFTIVAAAQNTPTPTPTPTPSGTAIASTGETFPMTVLYGIAMLIASALCIAVMSFIKPKKYKVRKVKL